MYGNYKFAAPQPLFAAETVQALKQHIPPGMVLFSNQNVLIFFLFLHENKALHMSTHNIGCFCGEIRNVCTQFLFLSWAMINPGPAEPGYALPLQTLQIQISWLLKKPTDLDLHCLPFSMWLYQQPGSSIEVIWLAEN